MTEAWNKGKPTKMCPTCKKSFVAKSHLQIYDTVKCREEMVIAKAKVDKKRRVFPKDAQSSVPTPQKLAEPIVEPSDTSQTNPFNDKNNDYDVEASLAAFKRMGLSPVEWISTGIPEFDKLTQIPRGRITQIAGRFSSGKTTLALNMLRGMGNTRVLYIDAEAALNPELLVSLQINPNNFTLYNESAFIEDIYDVIVKASETKKYDLIILDSLASTTFRTEAAGEAADANLGQKAKIVSKMLRIIPMNLKANDTALIIINQERDIIGGYRPGKYFPGGRSVEFTASLMLYLKTIPSWRFPKSAYPDGPYEGHEVEIEITKSKVNQPYRRAKFKLFYPKVYKPIDPNELMI